MHSSHYLPLVAASFVVAVIASYTALDLCSHVTAARGLARRVWLFGGSVALGVGIWSMHFIAMLALHLEVPIRYDIPVWLLSMVIAVIASLLALSVACRPTANMRSLLAAAPLMGLGIAGMHYTGMAAMRIPGRIRYEPGIVVLSVAIAIVASFAALWLSLRFRDVSDLRAQLGKAASAFVMGLAICGMHYTGMAAVSFHGAPVVVDGNGMQLLATRGLAMAVILTSLLVLALALVSVSIDRRRARTAALAEAALQREIDERLEVQKRLRDSEESYKSLFDSLTELVYVMDVGGNLLDVNSATESAYGYRRDELIGKPTMMLFDSNRVSGSMLEEHVAQAAGGTSQQFESWGRRKTGETFPIEVVLSPARYFGDPVVLGAARDITERKIAELELAAAEAHYRRLVESSPYGIFTCDSSGRLMNLNPAAQEIFSGRDVAGHSLGTLLEGEDEVELERALTQLRNPHVSRKEVEVRLRRASGEPLLLAINLTEASEPETAPILHGILRDITAERQQQLHLRRAERLAGVGTLIGGVAHELNNPLTAIQCYAELMLLEVRTGSDREALETMAREAHRAARIVSDLRLIARETQDTSEKEPELVDVNEVVRHVLKLRLYSLETANVQIQQDLETDPPLILGDRGQLEQIILNLVVNAGQAMENVVDRRLLIRTRSDGSRVQLEIGDSGEGIRPSDVDRIFDPFFTTKDPGEGTGLGLSLVHSLTSKLAGTISVKSERNLGTSFILEFPETMPTIPLPIMDPPPDVDAFRCLRVLIVDDEVGIRTVLHRYLERRGHVVETASDGAEALAILDSATAVNVYDVIVSDLRMPGLSGDKLLELLHRRESDLENRIIFITGDAANRQTMQLIEAANVPIVFKPFELSELTGQIEEFAEKYRNRLAIQDTARA